MSLLQPGDRLCLEGDLGTGKTTLSQVLLSLLGCRPAPQGSPTFGLVHQYDTPLGPCAHLDCYRLHSVEEAEARGLHEILWDPQTLVITEWFSLLAPWPESLVTDFRVFWIEIKFDPQHPDQRHLQSWSQAPPEKKG